MIYDEYVIEFLKKIKERINVKIFGGLFLIVSYRNVMFLNNELLGVIILEKYINMFLEDMIKEEG